MIVFDSIQLESTLYVWKEAADKHTHGEKHASFQSLGAVGSTLLERMETNGLKTFQAPFICTSLVSA
jgi:hypothetical protein